MTTNFRVGQGIGIVSECTLALLEPMNAALAEQLWRLVDDGAGIDELLEQLSATGLRSLGSFTMAQFEEGGVRIVVRGTARATVSTSTGAREITALGVRTWVEEVVDGAAMVHLSLDGPVDGHLPFRASAGLLPADVLTRGADDRPQLASTSFGQLASFAADDVLRGAPALSSPPAPVGPAPTERAASEPAQPEHGPSEPADDPAQTRMVDELGDHAPVPVTAPPQPAPDSVDTDGDEGDEYDAIYGRTVARSVQSAAVHVAAEESSDVGAAEPSAAATASSDLPAAPAPPIAPSAPTEGPISSVPLIQEIPSATNSGPSLGDHDGRTMTKAQIEALRAAQSGVAAAPPAAAMGGPTVQALICPNGHANPPLASACIACRAPLAAPPVQIARPVLGVLVFGNGTRVVLDRPALIGRNPKLEGALPNEMPTLVRLDVGQGLSRSHAAVRLEGWQVLLEDLHSANGTVVQLPGRDPRRLHPGEPVLLEPGAHIDFGGEIDCRLESA